MIHRFTEDPFVALMYLILRDHVHPGDLEHAVRDVSEGWQNAGPVSGFQLTNGFLADYARDLVERLDELRPIKKP